MIRGIACKGCYYVATLDPPPPLFGSGRLSTQRGETFSKIRPERKKKRASARRWMFRGFRARLFMCFCARTLCMMQLISVQILLVAFFVVLFCIVALARAQSLQFLRETRNILIEFLPKNYRSAVDLEMFSDESSPPSLGKEGELRKEGGF